MKVFSECIFMKYIVIKFGDQSDVSNDEIIFKSTSCIMSAERILENVQFYTYYLYLLNVI